MADPFEPLPSEEFPLGDGDQAVRIDRALYPDGRIAWDASIRGGDVDAFRRYGIDVDNPHVGETNPLGE